MDNRIFDEIRKNVDIVDVIQSYIPLTKIGKNYRGLCPFHNDSSPSMYVSPDKQIYRCFSCGQSGNAFSFVRDYEKVSFIDAVRKVCKISGLKIPSEIDKISAPIQEDKYSHLYSLMKDLSDFYNYQVLSQSNQKAIDYLNTRKLDKDIINTFRIGYCPESGMESIEFLKSKGYTDDEIISCGVGVEIVKNKLVDRLRGRVIFSIFNPDGKVVAFSGRRIIDSMGEKYVNSPETVLFHKSNTLYNYSNAIVNTKRDGYCYIVEGFMDAIALYKSGITDVVATMGTAFTNDHIKLLKQLRCQIRLFFDGDDPGQIATNKCIDILKNTGLDIKVVRPLTKYKDIDEMLDNESSDSVKNTINDLLSVIEYKISYFAKYTNFDNHEDNKKFVLECMNFLNQIELDEIDKDYYLNEISKMSNVTVKALKTKLVNNKNQFVDEFENSVAPSEVQKALNKYDLADHQILQMMMTNPLYIIKYCSMHIDLTSKTARQLANMIIDRNSKGLVVSPTSLLDQATPEVARLIGDIDREQFPPADIAELAKIVQDDYLQKLNKEDMKTKLNQSADIKEQLEIAKQLIQTNIKKK